MFICQALAKHRLGGFMSARGYHAAKSRPSCAWCVRDCELIPVMMGIHQDNYSAYGVRTIVGWAPQTRLATEALPLQALNQAIETAKGSLEELVHHSDHGSQYVSIAYHERLRHKRVQFSLRNTFSLKLRSTTRAETVNGLYKAELIHQRTWDGLADVEWETMCWVHWWNTPRIHSELDYHTPQEIEDHYRATNPTTLIPAV